MGRRDHRRPSARTGLEEQPMVYNINRVFGRVNIRADNALIATIDLNDKAGQYLFARLLFSLTRDRDDVAVYDTDAEHFISGVAGETAGKPVFQYSDGTLRNHEGRVIATV